MLTEAERLDALNDDDRPTDFSELNPPKEVENARLRAMVLNFGAESKTHILFMAQISQLAYKI